MEATCSVCDGDARPYIGPGYDYGFCEACNGVGTRQAELYMVAYKAGWEAAIQQMHEIRYQPQLYPPPPGLF